MTNADIVLISHSSVVWPGARNLFVAETGRHLAITRNPLRDGAARLLEEGFDPNPVRALGGADAAEDDEVPAPPEPEEN